MEDALPISALECPYCSEPINAKSKKCKHCGEILDAQMRDLELLKSQRNHPIVFMNSGGAAAAASSSSGSEPALRRFPHWVHLIGVLLTGLLWLPAYILMYVFRNRRYYY